MERRTAIELALYRLISSKASEQGLTVISDVADNVLYAIRCTYSEGYAYRCPTTAQVDRATRALQHKTLNDLLNLAYTVSLWELGYA